MKNLNILIILFLLTIMAVAQTETTTIVYTYDRSGNRTGRTISMEKMKMKDSIVAQDFSFDNYTEISTGENQLTETLGSQVISVFPNPTEGLVKVNITNFGESKGYIRVFGVAGNLIKEIKPLTEASILDISDKPNGTYMMEVTLDGKPTVWKLIKK